MLRGGAERKKGGGSEVVLTGRQLFEQRGSALVLDDAGVLEEGEEIKHCMRCSRVYVTLSGQLYGRLLPPPSAWASTFTKGIQLQPAPRASSAQAQSL